MSPLSKVILAGAVLIVAFDAAASFASLRLGFAYSKASIGSWIICALVGLVAAMMAGGLRASALAGLAMGVIDASLGWAVAWAIGPGRPPEASISATRWVITLVVVTLMSLSAAVAGGLIGSLVATVRGPRG